MKGCKSITMDEISAINGISKRTLYEIFADKSALLEACLTSIAKKTKEVSMRLKAESSNILEYILSFQDYESREAAKTSRVLGEELKKFYPEVYKRAIESVKNEQLEYTKSLIEEGVKEGLFESGIMSIDIVSKILTLLVGMNTFAVFGPTNMESNRKEIFMSSVVVYLRGLSTDKGREAIENYFKTRNIQ